MLDNVRDKEVQAFAAENDGDFEQAILIWSQVLEAYPQWENGYAHHRLAGCYTEIGKIDLAIDNLRKAIELSPEETMFKNALDSLMEARRLGHI